MGELRKRFAFFVEENGGNAMEDEVDEILDIDPRDRPLWDQIIELKGMVRYLEELVEKRNQEIRNLEALIGIRH